MTVVCPVHNIVHTLWTGGCADCVAAHLAHEAEFYEAQAHLRGEL